MEATIDCKEQEEASDVRYWKWLRGVLERLGEDGMSSEESDDDGEIETVYRPRTLEWRRKMDNELKLIDSEHRRLAKAQKRRGAKPVPRKRGVGKVSTRDPVCGLPAALYNENWLAKKSDLYVERTLQLSQERFKWKDWKVI